MDHTYFAEMSWDEETGVWYVSDTDFPGLVAEAVSERDLVERIRTLVPELYALNRKGRHPPRLRRAKRSRGDEESH